MAWWSGISPVGKYLLYDGSSGYLDKSTALGGAFANIETNFASIRYYRGLDYGTPQDYPIPDLELTTRPKPSEIVQYADWSQRAQGPYSFQWGFRVLKPWVFGEYMKYCGFEDYNYTSGYFYDFNPPVWTSALRYIMTLDSKGTTADNWRYFSGKVLRPVPNQHYKTALGGNYENVIFRFVDCTEIFV